jgi:glycosyltransferase involved in cell wall biosynthesis
MKILIVSPILPYRNVGHGGGAILFRLIEILSRRHQLFLAAMYEPFEKEKLVELQSMLEIICAMPRKETSAERLTAQASKQGAWQKIKLWTRGFLNDVFSIPTPDVKAFSDAVLRHVRQEHYDIIQIEFPQWLSYLVRRIGSANVVGAAHDVVFKAFERMRFQKKTTVHRLLANLRYTLSKRNELATYKHLRCVYTLSDFDKQLLLEADRTLNVHTRQAGFPLPTLPLSIKREPKMILFVGYLARGENQDGVWFLINEVMPIVWQKHPDASLHIVGGGAPKNMLEHHNGQTVVFHGYQEKLQPFYQRARVMAVPVFVGGGIITKLIESLMHALPSVSTTIGNEGVQAKPNEAILIADTATDFAKHINALIDNDEMHKRISQAARQHFENNFHIERVAQQLEQSYQQLLNKEKACN